LGEVKPLRQISRVRSVSLPGGSALLWTLERGLGDAWTPAVNDAWVAAYTLVASVMRAAAASVEAIDAA
jgi:hemoglobin-like flavoprotein